jgi:hypothetical protein
MKIQIKDRKNFPLGAIRRVRHVETQLVRRERKDGIAECKLIQDFALYPDCSERTVPVRRTIDLRNEYDRRLLGEEGGRVDHPLEGGIIDMEGIYEAFAATNLFAIHCRPVVGGAAVILSKDHFFRVAKNQYS